MSGKRDGSSESHAEIKAYMMEPFLGVPWHVVLDHEILELPSETRPHREEALSRLLRL